MSFESPRSDNKVSPQEAALLYESLPDNMKTGYYGLVPEGETFSTREEAGTEAVPHVIVAFSNGRRISLHLTLKNGVSVEKQAEDIKQASLGNRNVADVQLVWR